MSAADESSPQVVEPAPARSSLQKKLWVSYMCLAAACLVAWFLYRFSQLPPITPTLADETKQEEFTPPAVLDWERRAHAGNRNAQYNIGLAHSKGWGTTLDEDLALMWFRKAAEQNLPAAIEKVAKLSSSRMFGDSNPPRFVDRTTVDRIGNGIPFQRDMPTLPTKANLALIQVLKAGPKEKWSPLTMCIVGDALYNGWGEPRDEAEAVKLYRAAAESGHARAKARLGAAYAEGRGVPRDFSEAVRLFKASAEQGDAAGQLGLGTMLELGQAIGQDRIAAMDLYRKSAATGYADGQWIYGMAWESGLDGMKDLDKAMLWYRKAAEQGQLDAMRSIGLLYYEGRGVSQDYGEAFRWLRRAGGWGDVGSQRLLGEAYAMGTVVPQDIVLAYAWYLAAAATDADAKAELTTLEGKMTPEQVSKAKAQSAKLIKAG